MTNRFEKSLERIKRVEPQDSWTSEDFEHYKTVKEALEWCADHIDQMQIREKE